MLQNNHNYEPLFTLSFSHEFYTMFHNFQITPESTTYRLMNSLGIILKKNKNSVHLLYDKEKLSFEELINLNITNFQFKFIPGNSLFPLFTESTEISTEFHRIKNGVINIDLNFDTFSKESLFSFKSPLSHWEYRITISKSMELNIKSEDHNSFIFTKTKEYKIENGKTEIVLRACSPIKLQEHYLKSFKLYHITSSGKQSILLPKLPYPNISSIRKENDYLVSDIYVSL